MRILIGIVHSIYFMKLKLSKSTKNTITNHPKNKLLFTPAGKKSKFSKIMVRNATLEATSKIFINMSRLHSFAAIFVILSISIQLCRLTILH